MINKSALSAVFLSVFFSVSSFANTEIDDKRVQIIDSIKKCGELNYRVNDEEQDRYIVFDSPSKTQIDFNKEKIHIFIPNPNVFDRLNYSIYIDGRKVQYSDNGSVRLRDEIETIEWREEGCQIGVVATGGGTRQEIAAPTFSVAASQTDSQLTPIFVTPALPNNNGGGNNGGGNNGSGNNNGGNPCGGNCGNGNGNGGGNGTGNQGNGNGPGNNNGGGNNGHGNGDQDAPGNSGGNNNAENASGSKGKGKGKNK